VLDGVKGISFTYFQARDVVRHPLVQAIVEAYDAFENDTGSFEKPDAYKAADGGKIPRRKKQIMTPGSDIDLCLDIDNVSAHVVPGDAEFEAWVRAALHSRRDAAEISLRIVDGDEIAALNRQYRGKDYATNVLSFPADLPPQLKLPHLGDIVICAAVVEREAVEQKKPALAHWAHMIVHGTLHLLGYDHVDDNDAQVMESLEIEILQTLNFANPYIGEDVVDHV
jgi:probable rRNA maturation factor